LKKAKPKAKKIFPNVESSWYAKHLDFLSSKANKTIIPHICPKIVLSVRFA
jgi:hypothetical protein